MSKEEPQIVLDIFITKDPDRWVLLIAYDSWCPAAVASRMNERSEIPDVARPDLEELDAYMRRLDAPYFRKLAKFDGVQLRGEGRSAVALGTWLEEYLKRPVVEGAEPLAAGASAVVGEEDGQSTAGDSDRPGDD